MISLEEEDPPENSSDNRGRQHNPFTANPRANPRLPDKIYSLVIRLNSKHKRVFVLDSSYTKAQNE